MSFYSPIDRLAQNLPRPKGTGAEFMTELSKMPGYKTQEAEDRGLQALMNLPKMERAQFLEIMRLAKPAVVPKARDTQEEHHEEYTLPGGTNYREILLQHPNPKAKFQGVNAHFGGAPNILASVRAKDRTGPNGEKILHIEELQSDWHQQGREKGYASPETADRIKAAERAHRELKQKLEEAKQSAAHAEASLSDPTTKRMRDLNPEIIQRLEAAKIENNNAVMDLLPQVMKAEAEHQDLLHQSKNTVPDAPFKKNWHEMALKKMIHHAAANGYDAIAITPGAEQADRYSLARHISGMSYQPDNQHFYAFDPKGDIAIREYGASPERVSQLVGKELTQKLLTAPKQNGIHVLQGDNLQFGGEGMKGFYDKIVPNFLNQFGKKYGAKVQPGMVSIVSTPAQHHGLTEREFQALPPNAQQDMVRQHAYAHQGAKTEVPVHTFPITPEMREDVTKNGVPLYADGGSVEGEEPKKTVKAYKLFRVHPKHPGKLFPLFVDANTPVEMDKWIDAKEGEMAKGKVKSKIGPLAYRPGWHAGDLPIATHIGEKSDPLLTAPDVRPENHAWAEVEMPDDVDWQSEATKRGTNAQGRVIPVKAHITDQIPKGGHYRYKTNPNMTGNWLIGGSMKVNRVLTDKEVAKINKAAGLADLPRAQPFKAKKFGFAGGGTVAPDEWMAEEHVNHKAKNGSMSREEHDANLAKFLAESKIKDRLYHGTASNFNVFRQKPYRRDEDIKRAIFASPDPNVAERFAKSKATLEGNEGANIMPVYVQAKNPFDYDNKQHVEALINHIDNLKHKPKDFVKTSPAMRNAIYLGDFGYIEDPMVRNAIQDLGHDSFYVREFGKKNIGVLNPHQIKSAIGNRGTYDPNDPDITKAKGGSIKPVGYTKERVTVSPNLDAMRYEMESVKHYTKKVK